MSALFDPDFFDQLKFAINRPLSDGGKLHPRGPQQPSPSSDSTVVGDPLIEGDDKEMTEDLLRTLEQIISRLALRKGRGQLLVLAVVMPFLTMGCGASMRCLLVYDGDRANYVRICDDGTCRDPYSHRLAPCPSEADGITTPLDAGHRRN